MRWDRREGQALDRVRGRKRSGGGEAAQFSLHRPPVVMLCEAAIGVEVRLIRVAERPGSDLVVPELLLFGALAAESSLGVGIWRERGEAGSGIWN